MMTTTSSTETNVASDGTPPPSPPCSDTLEENFAKDVPDNADMHFAYATTEGTLLKETIAIISYFKFHFFQHLLIFLHIQRIYFMHLLIHQFFPADMSYLVKESQIFES